MTITQDNKSCTYIYLFSGGKLFQAEDIREDFIKEVGFWKAMERYVGGSSDQKVFPVGAAWTVMRQKQRGYVEYGKANVSVTSE